jgi:DNA mismatch repair protein MutS2
MDDHALELLEFPAIIEELAGFCVSPQGAALLRTQPFATENAQVEETLALSVAFRAVLESGAPFPGFDFPDLSGVTPLLGKQGLQLEGEELAAIGLSILSALKLKRAVLRGSKDAGLSSLAEAIPDLSAVSRRIFHVVDRGGLLRERRIPELAAIRERIRRCREETDRTVRGMLEDPGNRSYWQTTTPTQRDGRIVLPLKAQFKGRVKGIVHEMSSSGATIFIEPFEVVEKNNAIVHEENLYRQEVRRILREATAEVSSHSEEVARLVQAVAELDSILARARFAVVHSCRRAEIDPSVISLRKARHPLLGGRVVPVSLTMGGESRVLIITGPNTGGKTVSLKMVGLFALMNQFGLEIPAEEGSRMPVFDGVFADIGDEQSIEQSLSTFSAHVKNLSTIARGATARSLLLLDELGAGTDPEEGVALAMALLDLFLETGCIVIVSTHHGILKNYGATRRGAQNASMGFDPTNLSPTFRIHMGIPGESHALEIARRSGIPGSVLDRAFSYLDDERTDISRLVSNLAERHQRLAVAEEEQQSRETDLREKRRKTDLRELTLRQKELELRRHGVKDLRDFIAWARKEWETLRERTGRGPDAADFGKLAARIQERVESEEQKISQESDSLAPAESFAVKEGMEVIIARSGRRGRVVRKDKGKRWIVETETLRLSLLPGELRPAGAVSPTAGTFSVSFHQDSNTEPPSLELHIRGMRLEEAMRLVEKQLDSALLHGLRMFGIVHGKGEGILRKAIHEYLRKQPAVSEFHFSAPEEGGYGKTIVHLK